ncbi:MAG: hypothetical protein JKX81_15815, partial [Arenicella sp.]|nr:hypothetical protein [Arenicella sp.]
MDVLIVKLKGSVILVLTLIMGVFVGTVYANEQEIDVQKLTVEEKLKLYNISRELDENTRKAPRKRASQTDIENEVAKFHEFDTGMKARAVGTNDILTKSSTVSRVDADLENRYMQDGKYIVTVHYYNDANYPEKYFSEETFKENDSELFFSQTSTQIFS